MVSRWLGWWRHLALAGVVVGLLTSAHVAAPDGWLPSGTLAAIGVTFAGREVLGERAEPRISSIVFWLLTLTGVAALFGLGIGTLRIESIDAGAMPGQAGDQVEIRGYVVSPPRVSYGEVRIPVAGAAGRVVAVAPARGREIPVGSRVHLRGRLSTPDDFRADELERFGAQFELQARRVELTGGSRGGFTGALDRIRERADDALGEGVDPEQAALARGFVLGQDDRIDPVTREQFRRSGLSHLLAVSGQNVMLLALLAGVALAAFGLKLRSRLALTLLVIALYVPIAGGGPSIQRAGVMGAAAIVATLVGRPSDRAYPALLAATITLTINPRVSGDVGWQLSFAAVFGIMLWAGSLRDLIGGPLGRRLPGALARGLSDGIAITLAATIATVPLIAHDFERISMASIPANILVLPAVAPVMWLGMLIGLIGQIPGFPVAALGWVEGHLLDYIAAVAAFLGAQPWSEVSVEMPGAAPVIVSYLLISLAFGVGISWVRRRRGLRLPRRALLGLSAAIPLGLLAIAPLASSDLGARSPATLQMTELDVGQGDATLLEPPRGPPVLVDGGPPGGAAADALTARGIDRLGAVFVTNDELDHAGGLYEVFDRFGVDALIHARRAPRLESTARAAGARVMTMAEGSSISFGPVQIDALWPPREHIESPIAEANDDSLVLAVRFKGYDALLTGDAEEEAIDLDPGPFDVLKVAHHGSDDAGLSTLLDRSVPRVALIGVGADNSYGHPTDATLQALAEHGVCTLRTDLDGAITVQLGPEGVAVDTSAGPPSASRPGCEAQGG